MKSAKIELDNYNIFNPEKLNAFPVKAGFFNNLHDDVVRLYPVEITFTRFVPFDKVCSITKIVITEDIKFVPNSIDEIPGGGALYRLIGDGSHTPTFEGFKKSAASGEYDNTSDAINLVVFLFDGVDYWYSITTEFFE